MMMHGLANVKFTGRALLKLKYFKVFNKETYASHSNAKVLRTTNLQAAYKFPYIISITALHLRLRKLC